MKRIVLFACLALGLFIWLLLLTWLAFARTVSGWKPRIGATPRSFERTSLKPSVSWEERSDEAPEELEQASSIEDLLCIQTPGRAGEVIGLAARPNGDPGFPCFQYAKSALPTKKEMWRPRKNGRPRHSGFFAMPGLWPLGGH